MREGDLLARERPRTSDKRDHKGTIIQERPDSIWAIDLTSTSTEEGQVGIFAVVDHYTAKLLSVHATLRPAKFEANICFH